MKTLLSRIASTTTFAMLLFLPLALKSQPRGNQPPPRIKLEEFRKNFYNDKLALTEEEKKKFWPIFDEYKAKEKVLLKDFRAKYGKNDVYFMDDAKAEQYLKDALELKEKQLSLYKEYVEKFKTALPIKKVALLPMVEKEFKKELLRKAREIIGDDDE